MDYTNIIELQHVIISLVSFLIGVATGWILRSLMDTGKINFDKIFQAIIFLLITIAWAGSMMKSVVWGGEATPLVLNMFFGAVVGSTAQGFKVTLIEIINALYHDKKDGK